MGCLSEGLGSWGTCVPRDSHVQVLKHMSMKPAMRQNTGQKFFSEEVS